MLGTLVGFVMARSAWTARKPALCKTVLRELSGINYILKSYDWCNQMLFRSRSHFPTDHARYHITELYIFCTLSKLRRPL
jgi:hypothetical protein